MTMFTMATADIKARCVKTLARLANEISKLDAKYDPAREAKKKYDAAPWYKKLFMDSGHVSVFDTEYWDVDLEIRLRENDSMTIRKILSGCSETTNTHIQITADDLYLLDL